MHLDVALHWAAEMIQEDSNTFSPSELERWNQVAVAGDDEESVDEPQQRKPRDVQADSKVDTLCWMRGTRSSACKERLDSVNSISAEALSVHPRTDSSPLCSATFGSSSMVR
jgi:hypothetical protein